ncbi:MAG: hypothetical protein IKK62_07555 [Bacteroidaceae bacterium]|nr:hypothetical protein [Bacteroidaceae bacterium]
MGEIHNGFGLGLVIINGGQRSRDTVEAEGDTSSLTLCDTSSLTYGDTNSLGW